ncbi:MAG TPA: putative motility protein [Epulopiscium sp.]|nr:putative motility protein [Candidatus Epulonipiscium sp.]
MDIAALSSGLSNIQVSQEASVSVMKMAMDTATMQSNELTKMMEQSVTPHLGASVDISL